jgi:hypothetical protein
MHLGEGSAGEVGKGRLDGGLAPVGMHDRDRRRARREACQDPVEDGQRRRLLTVDLDDDVARLHAGIGGWPSRLDGPDAQITPPGCPA